MQQNQETGDRQLQSSEGRARVYAPSGIIRPLKSPWYNNYVHSKFVQQILQYRNMYNKIPAVLLSSSHSIGCNSNSNSSKKVNKYLYKELFSFRIYYPMNLLNKNSSVRTTEIYVFLFNLMLSFNDTKHYTHLQYSDD